MEKSIDQFFVGKSVLTRELYDHFIKQFRAVAPVTIHPAKTMIGIATPRKRIAYVTQFGKNFIHVVFPFDKAYEDNLCFQKVAKVPDDSKQYNHHFRMLSKDDVNPEVKKFMKLAVEKGS
jgi:hypothetical protein